MKRGACASSPSARRISRMQTFSAPSATNVSGQSASSSSAFLIRRPGRDARYSSSDSAFGVNEMGPDSPWSCPLEGSSLKRSKVSRGSDAMVLVSPSAPSYPISHPAGACQRPPRSRRSETSRYSRVRGPFVSRRTGRPVPQPDRRASSRRPTAGRRSAGRSSFRRRTGRGARGSPPHRRPGRVVSRRQGWLRRAAGEKQSRQLHL